MSDQPQVSQDQILEALKKMDKRELRKLVAEPLPAYATSTSHKMSPVLAALPLAEIDGVATTLEQLATLRDGTTLFQDAWEELPPELAQVLRANAQFRGKPISHSIAVAQRWIDENHGRSPKKVA